MRLLCNHVAFMEKMIVNVGKSEGMVKDLGEL